MSAGIDVHMMYNTAARVGDMLTATAVEIARSARIANYRIDVVRADGTLIAGMSGTAFITGRPAVA